MQLNYRQSVILQLEKFDRIGISSQTTKACYVNLNFYLYNAVLISHLTILDDLNSIQNLTDVVKDPNLQLIQLRGISSNEYFMNTVDEAAKVLWTERNPE